MLTSNQTSQQLCASTQQYFSTSTPRIVVACGIVRGVKEIVSVVMETGVIELEVEGYLIRHHRTSVRKSEPEPLVL